MQIHFISNYNHGKEKEGKNIEASDEKSFYSVFWFLWCLCLYLHIFLEFGCGSCICVYVNLDKRMFLSSRMQNFSIFNLKHCWTRWIISANKRSSKSTLNKRRIKKKNNFMSERTNEHKKNSVMQHLIFTHSIWNTLPSWDSFKYSFWYILSCFQYAYQTYNYPYCIISHSVCLLLVQSMKCKPFFFSFFALPPACTFPCIQWTQSTPVEFPFRLSEAATTMAMETTVAEKSARQSELHQVHLNCLSKLLSLFEWEMEFLILYYLCFLVFCSFLFFKSLQALATRTEMDEYHHRFLLHRYGRMDALLFDSVRAKLEITM